MKQLLLLFFVLVAFAGSISITQAQTPGTVRSIVKCGTIPPPGQLPRECGFNDLVIMFQDGIEFTIVYIIIPLITLVVLYYGVMMVIAGNKPAQLEKAKKALWSVVVGLFFMLTAWLLVSAAIRAFDVQVNTNPTQGPIKLLDTEN